ncbi:MAG: carbohydrate-binding domain-containing protein, partial [Bacteroidota bacterium]
HVNDGLNSQGIDKNLRLDYIIVGGNTYQAEDPSVIRVGCGDGEWLWCGGHFDFGTISAGAPPPSYTLSTSANDGSISLSPAGGTYDSGTVVTLTPLPNSGFEFDNWSGDASGSSNPIQIVMDGNKSVTANFSTIPTYSLNVSASNGSVSLSPAGGTYQSGTVVTLTATANSGYDFANWSGDASGASNPIQITMDGNKTVSANFTQQSGGGSDITIRALGSAAETTIELQIDDVAVATYTLTTSFQDYVYSGYSGSSNIKVAHVNDGLNSQGVDKNLRLDYIIVGGTTYQAEDPSVTRVGCGDGEWLWCNGHFDFGTISGGGSPQNYTLSVSASNGSVNLSPAGGSYASGTTVTMTATANSGYSFDNWSGDASGTTNPIQIVMDGNKSVTANFSAIPTYSLNVTAANGAVSLSPAGGNYQAGTVVTMTANPNTGYDFDNWSGDAIGGSNPIQITMDANKNVTANFSQQSSGSVDISLRALGNAGEETIELQLDDVAVATYTLTTAWQTFTYSGYSGSSNIKVAHVNDGLNSQGVDKNLRLDYITVGSTTYQAEDPSVIRVGCGDGEWLWCNGHFDFGTISSSSRKGLAEKIAVNIYPNPVSNHRLRVDFAEAGVNAQLKIYDIHGRLVFQQKLVGQTNQLNLNLATGTYTLMIDDTAGSIRRKLMILNN